MDVSCVHAFAGLGSDTSDTKYSPQWCFAVYVHDRPECASDVVKSYWRDVVKSYWRSEIR